MIWRLFYEISIRKRTKSEPADEAVVRRAREVEVPVALDYLETRMPPDGFIFGEPSIADVSIASYFRTAAFVRYAVDAARWPRVAALLDRRGRCPRFEECTLHVPLGQQRAALRAEGARLTPRTLGGGPIRPVAVRTS